jgi:hypothetical protein
VKQALPIPLYLSIGLARGPSRARGRPRDGLRTAMVLRDTGEAVQDPAVAETARKQAPGVENGSEEGQLAASSATNSP